MVATVLHFLFFSGAFFVFSLATNSFGMALEGTLRTSFREVQHPWLMFIILSFWT